MPNPPDSKKRPRDEGEESRVSPTSLRKLEEQLGYAMSQAGIVKMEREEKGRPSVRGVNNGSSGAMIYSLGSSYNRDLLKATLLKKSFSEVSALQTTKDSFVRLQRQLNADDLRLIYDQIKNIPRVNLNSLNLNLLCELKNVFLEIDKNKGLSEEGAPEPPTAREQEAQLFAEYNQSRFATQTRRELNERKPEDRPQKRQRTSENWWGGLTANFVPAIDKVTNNILSSSFLGNFGISLPEPQEIKSVKAGDLPSRDRVQIFKAELTKPNSSKLSSQNIEDRPYKFLCDLQNQHPLESSKFSTVKPTESFNYLLDRIKLWNKQLKKFGSVPSEYHDGSLGYTGNYERCILEYQKYLQASIKKIKTSNLEQGKILSGFLYLELAKVDHMVKGDNASADNSEHKTREVVTESLMHKEGLGWQESIKFWYRDNIGNRFPSAKYEHTDPTTSTYYSSWKPNKSEELRKIRKRLYSKIPEISLHAIYDAEYSVSRVVNFVDTINVPLTVETSQDFKSKFSEERTKFWNPPKKGDTSEPRAIEPIATPSPSPEKRSPIKEAQSVKGKINDNHTGVQNLQIIVDSPKDFSSGIFEVTSEIDIAIGVMKPSTSEFDFERHQQEGDLVKFLKDSKSLLNRGDQARGRSGGSDRRRENIYAYVEFLDDRIEILQKVVNDLKSSNPSQEMSIKKLKEMQANLGLELVRISDSLTPTDTFINKQDTNFYQRPATTSGPPNGLGPVHYEDLLKTLRAEKMEEELGPTFASMLDKNRFKASKSFAYSDKKIAPANQDFLKEKVDEALENFKKIRSENRRGGRGR